MPLYYYLLGRKLFGREIKYPLYRFGHIPERFLRGKMYLDFSNGDPGRYTVPERVQIPEERQRPHLPTLPTASEATPGQILPLGGTAD